MTANGAFVAPKDKESTKMYPATFSPTVGPDRRVALQRWRRMLLRALIPAALLAGTPALELAAQSPDFSTTTDILNGERTLLRNDHLIIGDQYCGVNGAFNCDSSNTTGDGDPAQSRTIDLQTIDSAIVITADPPNNDSRFFDSGLGGQTNRLPWVVRVLAGRMFNLPYDVIAYFNNNSMSITDPGVDVGGAIYAGSDCTDLPSICNGDFATASMGDFTRDGYADIVAVAHTTGGLQIITANEPGQPFDGVRFGPIAISPRLLFPNATAVTVGDFDGDGSQKFVTMSGGYFQIFDVDPKTLEINATESLCFVGDGIGTALDTAGSSGRVSLAAGRFGDATRDQLVMAWGFRGGSDTAKVAWFDVPATGCPTLTGTHDTGVAGPFLGIAVRSGHFDWSSQFEQAALKLGKVPDADGYLSILTFGFTNTTPPTPQITEHTRFASILIACSEGLAVGNFDRMQTNSSTNTLEHDPDLQLATANRGGGSGLCADSRVLIWNVDPTDDFSISPANDTVIPTRLIGSPDGEALRYDVAAGDTQTPDGRSFVLGEPSKVVINQYAQPRLIIGAPPMHVDYVEFPDSSGTEMTDVLNMSVLFSSFTTVYGADTMSDVTDSKTITTGWSVGATEKIGFKATIGDPQVTGVTAESQLSFDQAYERTAGQTDYSSVKDDAGISVTTAFWDQLFLQTTRENLFIYPVIGRESCLSDSEDPNCSKGLLPLVVTFAGPDKVSPVTSVQGNSVEWYQPPWEAGNVLSYPANQHQLEAALPAIACPKTSPTCPLATGTQLYTDGTGATEKSGWSTGMGGDQSVTAHTAFSGEASVSVAGVVSGGVETVGGSLDLSVDGSTSKENMITKQDTVAASVGITVNKPGIFREPGQYRYLFGPYIFGNKPPPLQVQKTSATTDIETHGPLRALFTADPTDSMAGLWWTDSNSYDQAPDVALNHPSRWQVCTANTTNCPNNTWNCLDGQCAQFYQPSQDKWMSYFHQMRGFFITDPVANGGGPQLNVATWGDQLQLQARVYNYSFKDMPDGSEVHVRFYYQPWDHANHVPLSGEESVLIQDVVLQDNNANPIQIPPFSASTTCNSIDPDPQNNVPPCNWVLASTTFDTCTLANAGQYVVFWVIVWMEDSSDLVAEVPLHGLTGIPGPLTSLDDTDNLIEDYSNNVGLYNFAFYLQSNNANACPTTALQATGVNAASNPVATPQATGADAAFRLAPVVVSSPHRFASGGSVEVRTGVDAGDDDVPGVTLLFYDGDPEAGGTVFDVERLAYVPAGDHHAARVRFGPTRCGRRKVFVQAGPGTPFEQVRSSGTIVVDCPR